MSYSNTPNSWWCAISQSYRNDKSRVQNDSQWPNVVLITTHIILISLLLYCSLLRGEFGFNSVEWHVNANMSLLLVNLAICCHTNFVIKCYGMFVLMCFYSVLRLVAIGMWDQSKWIHYRFDGISQRNIHVVHESSCAFITCFFIMYFLLCSRYHLFIADKLIWSVTLQFL